ncbi:hypothetical protein LTR84_000025 [Exophiala bonariae]|uniref:WD repeat protein n=1 Tax=Exophiala bonariae TaxID=1690606 RepID=A0AAV9NSZ3_9EURO|nr:hypothetical protein LTR84_000025 [Exophiala bonariae]
MLPSQASCLPVTALLPLECGQRNFVLVGQGPWLCAYDDAGVQTVCAQIFDVQPIQGFEIIPEKAAQNVPPQVAIAVWGGRWVRYGYLKPFEPDSVSSRLTFIPKPLFDAQDWILKIVAFHDDAPEHGQSPMTNSFMLTAHNTLLEVNPWADGEFGPGSCNVVSKVHGPQSFLYAADIKVIEVNHIIIASGTVFGEVITWTCQRSTTSGSWLAVPRHRYNGHRGSIFGVAISNPLSLNGTITRLMASCSDDRTIRVWDISDCDHSAALTHPEHLPVTTGFGHSETSDNLQLAASWGHASRIWNITFDVRQTTSGQDDVLLLSRGEDATCQLWSLIRVTNSNQGPSFVLQPVLQDRHHNGKNIWSFAQRRVGSSTKVYTGGADGQVILRNIGDGKTVFLHTSRPFKDITGSKKALKHYNIVTHEECIATTDSGELFMLTNNGVENSLNWTRILDPDSSMSLVIRYLRRNSLALLGMQNGSLAFLHLANYQLLPISSSLPGAISSIDIAYESRSGDSSMTSVIACLANKEVFVLWIETTPPPLRVKVVSLNLPDTFTVTASCYDPGAEVLLLGSRAGALAVYSRFRSDECSATIPTCFRHIHGEDSVTSIKILTTKYQPDRSFQRRIYVLTTGRDGYYAVHCVEWDSNTGISQSHLSTLHRSAPPFGPNVEGSYFTNSCAGSEAQTSDLILYGFRSTSYVVWNETQQSTLLSVECGGSHRSWSYSDTHDQMGDEVLQSIGHTSNVTDPVRTFVWTKAGNFNWYSVRGSPHRSIVKGGHGREIKALASCRGFSRPELQALPIVATGSEDTNIQMFALSTDQPEAHGNTIFQPLAILKGHTTGLQHLAFSSSGTYLFSSAGCEEFFVWKLTFNVPFIGVGVVLQDQMQKEAEDSDARIMSFDQKDISDLSSVEGYQEPTFLMTLAYSNGKVKIIKYTPGGDRGQGKFETLTEIVYGSFCLMQALLLSSDTTPDGRLLDMHILSAGTNGVLNISFFHLDDVQTITPRIEPHRVHQSSILSMDTVALNQNTWLAATGGDDNALGLTVISRATSMTGSSATRARSVCIAKAHAAALTALQIAEVKSTSTGFNLKIISVGNDQRLNVWEVEVSSQFLADVEDKLMIGLKVKRVHAEWTAVADVSAIELVKVDGEGDKPGDEEQSPAASRRRVMVVGVGMELRDVSPYLVQT